LHRKDLIGFDGCKEPKTDRRQRQHRQRRDPSPPYTTGHLQYPVAGSADDRPAIRRRV